MADGYVYIIAVICAAYLITEMAKEDIDAAEYDESKLRTPDARDLMEMEVWQ